MIRDGRTPAGKQRHTCYVQREYEGEGDRSKRAICYSTTNPKAPYRGQDGRPKEQLADPVFKRTLNPGAKRFIFTSAINNVDVHEKFWSCLMTARRALDAELLVIPIRYKNPTSQREDKEDQEHEWWDKSVKPFLWNVRKVINKNLTLLADIKTQATTSDPVHGYEAISGSSSAIIGHPKMQLKCIPTPQNRMPKILTTTGACTVGKYSSTKAGKMGEFHHSLSALIVEVDGSKFHLRQLHYDAKSGSFTDLDTRYFPDGLVSRAPPPEALIMGDTHVEFVDKNVDAATFGAGGIVKSLKPKRLVWHDLLDGYAINPHHRGNVFHAIAKIKANKANVENEVRRAVKHVIDRTLPGTVSLVIPSNHNDFLSRWLVDTDPRTVPGNFEFWCETGLAMARATHVDAGGTSYPEPFGYWGEKLTAHLRDQIKFLKRDESLLVAGVELSMHGDKGANGARGTARGLRRIGVRSVIGHSHTPGIEEGCYQVGTSTPLKLEYTAGPSSWLNTHCLLHADGKRQLIHIIDGKWRL
jgi:hypothetical protein